MSDTHQDEETTQPELTSGCKTEPASVNKFTSDSTPAKRKYGTDLIYASEIKKFDKVRKELGHEMHRRWVGAMPIDLFFENFLPRSNVPLPHVPHDAFSNVPKDGVESAIYGKFLSTEWTPSMHAVNTSNREDATNRLRLKTDISFYKRNDGVAPPERTDFSKMELWIEFKSKTQGAAFQDPPESKDMAEAYRLVADEGSFTPDTVDGINTRGQLAHYAGAQHTGVSCHAT